MSEPLPEDVPEDAERSESLPATTGQGSLLRLRDVQALNRSFRRLAEVQEALLDRLDALEQEHRSPWQRALPWLLAGGFALGAIALVLVLGPLQNEPAPPPEVIVEAPRDEELVQAVAAMGDRIAGLLEREQEHAREKTELTERLLAAEEERMDLLSRVGTGEPKPASGPGSEQAVPADGNGPGPGEDGAAEEGGERGIGALLALPDGPDTPVTGAAPAADSWVGVTNVLLRSDGFRAQRLQHAKPVEGEATLEQVVWMEWNDEGQVDSVIDAARAELRLQQMTGVLVIEFFDGWRARGGARTPLPAGGLRIDLDGVNVKAWLDHLPALGKVAEAQDAAARAAAESVRVALDELISVKGSYRYYRMNSLGAVDGRVLRLVQINWFRNDGALVKTLEADSMEVVLHEGGAVELLLHDGAFLEGRTKFPFSGDRFRLHLPAQDLERWRASGIPYREADA